MLGAAYFLLTDNIQRSNCTDGAVRLINGSGPHEGRLEVCVNEAWGTVCSNGWDQIDTNVVCNQLGYLSFGTVYALIFVVVLIDFNRRRI